MIIVANNENGVDEPAIWIRQHPTIPANNAKTKLSQTIELATTFEFVCIEYDPDPEIAELKCQDLASRAVLAILINFQQLQKEHDERVIKNIYFNMFYPVGEVQIQGKREKVPATSVVLDVIHRIEWLNCCKTRIEQEENNNDNGD